MSTAFRVSMNGSQETPPNGSAAFGLGVVIYDSVANTATYKVTVTGLDWGVALGGPAQTVNPNDDVTNLHVHSENPGFAGPVVFGQIGPAQDTTGVTFSAVINGNGSTTFQGRWDASDPASTSINTFSNALATSPIGFNAPLYFNAHSSGFPGGEIRGQWFCIADDSANNVAGTAGADILPGLGGNDTVNGFGGDDDLSGGDLRDRLTGGAGVDTLIGGTGKDFLRGDADADFLRGGGGKDKFVFDDVTDSDPLNTDFIFDFNAGAGETIDVSAIDAMPSTGGDQAFVIVAGFGGNEGEATLTYFSGQNQTAFSLDRDGDFIEDFTLYINGDQTGGVGFVL